MPNLFDLFLFCFVYTLSNLFEKILKMNNSPWLLWMWKLLCKYLLYIEITFFNFFYFSCFLFPQSSHTLICTYMKIRCQVLPLSNLRKSSHLGLELNPSEQYFSKLIFLVFIAYNSLEVLWRLKYAHSASFKKDFAIIQHIWVNVF